MAKHIFKSISILYAGIAERDGLADITVALARAAYPILF
jgi:hypothetical protein